MARLAAKQIAAPSPVIDFCTRDIGRSPTGAVGPTARASKWCTDRFSRQAQYVSEPWNRCLRSTKGCPDPRSKSLSLCAENDGFRCLGLARLGVARRAAITDCLGRLV